MMLDYCRLQKYTNPLLCQPDLDHGTVNHLNWIAAWVVGKSATENIYSFYWQDLR